MCGRDERGIACELILDIGVRVCVNVCVYVWEVRNNITHVTQFEVVPCFGLLSVEFHGLLRTDVRGGPDCVARHKERF